ncbi:fumarylacetoacetate hydrolase family protein [Pararhodospirillum oryzae]|uniref:Fumarylacetoacetate (FAA) hydrolase n=1 Tax=Pararhodospirillum oryzae TaxID=478448 RepID=A0A512H8V3_9PROT|nr:fumarylacetoacetate hydrolase family protein [Pararhodospirillum oryzae]GEO81885.1 fumarylacetoacetate (FAA) hydrolase [Pararhodospirillum oryzae]
MSFVLPEWPRPAVPVVGGSDLFLVRRVFCVGKNYADHAREMGSDPTREAPFFFSKPAEALVPEGGALPYPLGTANLHHEVELVVALGQGGVGIDPEGARDLIWGYGVGLDLTRRDLQAAAREKGQPWDMAKGFDRSAPIGPLTPASQVGPLQDKAITLRVNGTVRQNGTLGAMIWSVPEIISCLSSLIELAPGDLIFTGTPAGVGPIGPGDRLDATIDGLTPLGVEITLHRS